MIMQAETEAEIEEYADLGSFNHGYVQVRLGGLFDRMKEFTTVGELSLDVSGVELSQFDLRSKEEIKPDLALYPKRGLSHPKDILRMKKCRYWQSRSFHPSKGCMRLPKRCFSTLNLGFGPVGLSSQSSRQLPSMPRLVNGRHLRVAMLWMKS